MNQNAVAHFHAYDEFQRRPLSPFSEPHSQNSSMIQQQYRPPTPSTDGIVVQRPPYCTARDQSSQVFPGSNHEPPFFYPSGTTENLETEDDLYGAAEEQQRWTPEIGAESYRTEEESADLYDDGPSYDTAPYDSDSAHVYGTENYGQPTPYSTDMVGGGDEQWEKYVDGAVQINGNVRMDGSETYGAPHPKRTVHRQALPRIEKLRLCVDEESLSQRQQQQDPGSIPNQTQKRQMSKYVSLPAENRSRDWKRPPLPNPAANGTPRTRAPSSTRSRRVQDAGLDHPNRFERPPSPLVESVDGYYDGSDSGYEIPSEAENRTANQTMPRSLSKGSSLPHENELRDWYQEEAGQNARVGMGTGMGMSPSHPTSHQPRQWGYGSAVPHHAPPSFQMQPSHQQQYQNYPPTSAPFHSSSDTLSPHSFPSPISPPSPYSYEPTGNSPNGAPGPPFPPPSPQPYPANNTSPTYPPSQFSKQRPFSHQSPYGQQQCDRGAGMLSNHNSNINNNNKMDLQPLPSLRSTPRNFTDSASFPSQHASQPSPRSFPHSFSLPSPPPASHFHYLSRQRPAVSSNQPPSYSSPSVPQISLPSPKGRPPSHSLSAASPRNRSPQEFQHSSLPNGGHNSYPQNSSGFDGPSANQGPPPLTSHPYTSTDKKVSIFFSPQPLSRENSVGNATPPSLSPKRSKSINSSGSINSSAGSPYNSASYAGSSGVTNSTGGFFTGEAKQRPWEKAPLSVTLIDTTVADSPIENLKEESVTDSAPPLSPLGRFLPFMSPSAKRPSSDSGAEKSRFRLFSNSPRKSAEAAPSESTGAREKKILLDRQLTSSSRRVYVESPSSKKSGWK